MIIEQNGINPVKEAEPFLDPETGVPPVEDAIAKDLECTVTDLIYNQHV